MTLFKAVAWLADTIVNTVWPLERGPSLWDLEAEALADKEAEEEVAEPRHDYWRFPVTSAQFDHLIYLVEDIRNTLSSAALVSPEVQPNRPGSCEHSAAPEPGPPNLNYPTAADWRPVSDQIEIYLNPWEFSSCGELPRFITTPESADLLIDKLSGALGDRIRAHK